jgi:CheY-like chemotaxis protein
MEKKLSKILFVDDDDDIHIIVKMCLKEIPGLVMESALSGEEALKLAMSFHPDLILLDVMMPRMDGIATLQAIKLIPSLANVPVVFLTAKAQKDEIEEYYKYGVLEVITKPFDPDTLAQVVSSIWNNYQNDKK